MLIRRLWRRIWGIVREEHRRARLQASRDVTLETEVSISVPAERIGDHTFIGRRAVIGPNVQRIGKFCSIAAGAVIGPNQHPMNRLTSSAKGFSRPSNVSRREARRIYAARLKALNGNPTVIGNDVWIGSHAIVLPGVSIGDGAIIGAGSVVTKNVDPYSIVAGNPARFIRKRFSDAQIERLLELRIFERERNLLRDLNDAFDLEIDYAIAKFERNGEG